MTSLDHSIPVKHAWREAGCRSITPSNTSTQPTLHLILSRIEALENEFRSSRSQQSSSNGRHIACGLGTRSFPPSTPIFNTSPYAVAGLDPTSTQAPHGLQGEGTSGLGYSPSTTPPLYLNNAVDTIGSGFSPVAVGDSDSLYFNPGVNEVGHRDGLFVTTQDWDASLTINNDYDNGNFIVSTADLAAASTGRQANMNQSVAAGPASQMTDNSEFNSYSELQSFGDLFDFSGASVSSEPGTAARDGISVAPQVDAGHLAEVVAPRSMISTSSGNQGADTSHPRRHLCTVSMQCHKSFARRADRNRHELKHNQNSYLNFPCPFPGCDRVGTNGFCRADKLKSHRTKRGH